MKRSYKIWLLAVIITLASAVYQRLTGPTHPKHYVTLLNATAISVTLERAHGGDGDHIVSVETKDTVVTGRVEYKRYNTSDEYTSVPMTRAEGRLSAALPHQPPAGKLNYRVVLTDGKQTFTAATVIRFRGDVPLAVLLLHVGFMFTGMLFATRTGLETFTKEPNLKRFTDVTLALMTIGGMVLGPMVLQYAFNEWWTGFPFGTDITDNKTLVTFIVWIVAAVAVRRSANPKRWILAASLITLAVFLIPHSLWGTELDYNTMKTN